MAILSADVGSQDDLKHAFSAWLKTQASMANTVITEFTNANDASGYSNETYLIKLKNNGQNDRLILRLPPLLEGLFPRYDLHRQYTFMQGLVGAKGLAMGGCRWLETNTNILGRPFYVVDCVDGDVPEDSPPYNTAGWVCDASDEQRHTLWVSTLEQLANLSKVRWQGKQLAAVDWQNRNQPRLAQHLQWYANLSAWGRTKLGPANDPIVDQLRVWLQRNMPKQEEPGIVWGDSRIGNIIYHNYKPAALLDWELAVIGDPEIDLSYMLYHQFFYEALNPSNDNPQPRLKGFLSDEDSVAYYTELTGKAPKNYHYYWLFNAYRLYVILECLAPLMMRMGALNEEEAIETRRLAPITPFVEQVLGSATRNAFIGK